MRKRGLSAIVPIILIAGLTIAEVFCSSVPTHAKEDNSNLQNETASNGNTTLNDNPVVKRPEQTKTGNDEPTYTAKTSIDNSSSTPTKELITKELYTKESEPKVPDKPIEPLPEIPVKEEYKEVEYPVPEDLPSPRVTFRILDSSEGDIDSSVAYSTGNSYIAEIEIDGAIGEKAENKFSPSTSDDSNIKISGITLQNEIASSLNSYPTEDDIKKYCSFNPKTQYVAWYYINADYYDDIYVDGVIRTRTTPVEEEPVAEKEPAVEKKPEFVPDVTIKIETTCDISEFEYDGEEHYFGGFSITVEDNDPLVNSVTTFFDALGNFVSKKVNAGENGSGTYFEHNNIRYWVNIDAAYIRAKQVAAFDNIPFIFNNEVIEPKDIVVKVVDDAGNVISSVPTTQIAQNKASSQKKLKVTPRKLTIEAGTTVQNYSGNTITNKEVKITSGSLLKGHELVDVVINGSQSGIGSSVNEITSYRIIDENGNDVTSYYDVKCTNGKLVLVDGNNGNNSKSSNDTTTDTAPVSTTKAKDKNLPKKALIIGGKTLEKTSSKNDDNVLGKTRLARMSKTYDASNTGIKLWIILIAAIAAIRLLMPESKSLKK